MKTIKTDLLVVGAGPVGLMCAYLAHYWNLKAIIIDRSAGPLQVGRADALNARTLQFLEIADLFNELYPKGKICDTSSVWSRGRFESRKSSWWRELKGCFHKHFLMLGQAHIEKLLDTRLTKLDKGVRRLTTVQDIEIAPEGCLATLSDGTKIESCYLIGADGSRSFVRDHFDIEFSIVRPKIIWAVIDGVIESDFPKVPEIIVFQSNTSDVAWIPREGNIDRFYIRMDKKDFSREEVVAKINKAMKPHSLKFKEVLWFSQFSVKESVAEKFSIEDKVFLAGDSCHIHSVNGGQGLNTGLSDAFNLIWKLGMFHHRKATKSLLKSYESERKAVAKGVIETSGELVRSTKYSPSQSHANDYVKIVEKRAGYITGMGISYNKNKKSLKGKRLYDFQVTKNEYQVRIYSLLDYTKFTLLIFSYKKKEISVPEYSHLFHIHPSFKVDEYWGSQLPYEDQVLIVRPDSYIEFGCSLESIGESLANFFSSRI